jgi:hypothetical protein
MRARISPSSSPWSCDAWVDCHKLMGGTEWPAELRQAIEACDLFPLVLSPRALASAAVRKEYLYALQRRKRLVPILYKAVRGLPDELRDFQWVDFSRRTAPGPYDLVTALDALGLDAKTSLGVFDGDLALARAMRGKIPPEWSVVRVAQRWYQRRRLTYSLSALLALAALVWIGLLVVASPLASGPQHLALFLLIVGTVLVEEYVLIRRAFFSRWLSGRPAPELIVLGTEGFVVREYRFWGMAGARDTCYQFGRASRIIPGAARGRRGTLALTAKLPARRRRLVFPRQFGDTTWLALQIGAAFELYTRQISAAHGVPGRAAGQQTSG